jgi:simple sugar transport system ATP-binding protein
MNEPIRRGGLSSEHALEVKGISKAFGSVRANDNISLDIRRGEIQSLLGENGAGKTTLVRIIAGLITPDSGTISLSGEEVEVRDPLHASELGIQMVHQHFALIDTLTVAENLHLARLSHLHKRIELQSVRDDVSKLAKANQLLIEPDALVSDLSVGARQRVEIARALLLQADVLILDEPTAVLTPQETAELFRLMRGLTAEGVSIIFISHKLSEVLEISDRISVLRHGRLVETFDVVKATSEVLSTAMVGRQIIDRSYRTGKADTKTNVEPALSVRRVTTAARSGVVQLKEISFEVFPGEILGVAGIDGNGQSELVDAVIGLDNPVSGSVEVAEAGQPNGKSPMAHIPDDRAAKGLIPSLTIWENILLGRAGDPRYIVRGVVRRSAARAAAREELALFGIKRDIVDIFPPMLSGGMQQRVLLARELAGAPTVIIAAQPTRGLDIQGAEFIRSTFDSLRADGAAILLVSTELEEILALTDRVVVMFRGTIVGEFRTEEADLVSLGLMMGGQTG